ncbi:MAG: zinc metallopeptidase [Bacteroidia bacterium]|nr:zinc metallopeptidase [Bacteroidia bacterium]
MKWRGREQSGNVEDRRGMGRGLLAGGGIIGIIVALITVFISKDPSALVQLAEQQTTQPMSAEQKAAQEDQAEFTAVVLKDTEDVWDKLFPEYFQKTYIHPKLVLFSGSVQSGCGGASSETGPFYCPADSKVYIDLSFFDELKSRFRAPGDFACAYVIAHEVGHHVQNLLGTSGDVARMRGRVSESEYNRMSVKLELQADFYAGVWAHHAQKMKSIIEKGDIEEALNAANAIGDDRLQKEAQGYTVPDAFTHGTSEQRMYWFKKGYESGDVRQGDTFSARGL